MTEQVDATWYSGDSREIDVTAVDANGAALDLTSLTTIYSAQPDDGSAPKVTLTNSDGITYTDAVNGLMTIAVPKNRIVTPKGRITRWTHSCRCEDGSGNSVTIFVGVVTVHPSPASPS